MEPPPLRCSICRHSNGETTCTGCVCKMYFTDETKDDFAAISYMLGGESRVRDALEPLNKAEAFFWIYRKLRLVAGDDAEDQDALTEKLAAAEAEVLELKQKLADSKRQIEKKQLPQKIAISSLYDPLLGHCEPAIFMIDAKVIRFRDQSIWLLTCNVCKDKVTLIQSTGVYWCDKCKTSVGPTTARLAVLFEVSNESSKVWLSAFDSQAEKVVGCSANELFRIEAERGSDAFQMKLKAAVGKEFVFSIDVTPFISRLEVNQSIKVIEAAPVEILEIPPLEDGGFQFVAEDEAGGEVVELPDDFARVQEVAQEAVGELADDFGIQQVDSTVHGGATTTEQVDSTALVVVGAPVLAAASDTVLASSSSTDSAASPPQKFRSLATLLGNVAQEVAPRRGRGGNPRRRRRGGRGRGRFHFF